MPSLGPRTTIALNPNVLSCLHRAPLKFKKLTLGSYSSVAQSSEVPDEAERAGFSVSRPKGVGSAPLGPAGLAEVCRGSGAGRGLSLVREQVP